MTTRRFWLVLLAVALGGCVPDLGVPSSTTIACSDDVDCPNTDWVCNPTQGICVSRSVKDFEAPALSTPPVVEPEVLAAGATATLTLTFDEPLAESPDVWFSRRGERVGLASVDSTDSTTWFFAYEAGAEDVEGYAPLSVQAVDMVGNALTTELEVGLVFDFTLPAVRSGSVVGRMWAGADNVVGNLPGQPEALAADGTVEIAFDVSEELSEIPEAWLLGPSTLPAAGVALVGEHITATFDMATLDAADGSYTSMRVRLVDVATNAATVDIDLTSDVDGVGAILLDLVPPDPADVDTERAVVYVRAPWGQRATAHEPSFGVIGAPGSVEDDAYVATYDSTTADPDDPLSFARAATDGSFGPIPVGAADLSQVFVRVSDAAGNLSELTRVRDTDWIASTSSARSIGSPPNPHHYYVQPRAAGLPIDGVDTNVAGDAALDEADAQTLSTLGAGQWRSRLESLEPPWRYRARMFNDPSTNDLYLLGGTVDGSDVTQCDGTSAACHDLYRRKLLSWESVSNAASPGEDLPQQTSGFLVTYDVARARVVAYDTETGRLWEWTNGIWRPHSDADPADLGPQRRFADSGGAAGLVYDAVRARLVLFGGWAFTSDCDGVNYCDHTWVWDGSWHELATPVAPPGRVNPVMVYDSVRDVVVLTGGYAKTSAAGTPCGDGNTSWELGRCYFRDTWELDGDGWQKRCDGDPVDDTCSQVPFRMELSAAVFDPEAGHTQIFGGRAFHRTTDPPCDDGSAPDALFQCVYETSWTWDGFDWQRYDIVGGTSDTDPLPRWGASLGFDIKQGKVILFGGIRASNVAPAGFRLDTYEWQGDGWLRQRNPYSSNPPGETRMDFAMARTASGGAFLFAGEDLDNEACGGAPGTIQCSDAFYWGTGLGTTPAWTTADCDIGTSCPVEAGGVRAAFDPSLGDVVIAGGHGDGGCNTYANEYCLATWTADGLDEGWNWTRHTVTMMQRAYHAMAEPGSGAGGNTVCNGAGPYVFGGLVGASYFNTLHKYNTSTGGWTELCNTCDPKPEARAWATMACDDVNDALIVFGGELPAGQDCGNGTRFCGDTWRYRGSSWEKVAVLDPEGDGNPAPRSGHVMIWDEGRRTILLHGGTSRVATSGGDCGDGSVAVGTECLYGDLWEWTGASWARVNVVETDSQGSPGRRAKHGMAHLPDRQESLLFGGRTRSNGDIHTWYWQSGFDSRPRHVFEVQLTAAQAGSSAVIRDLEVAWDAGGIADSGSCAAQQGARLLVLQAGSWSAVAENSANTTAPTTLSWTFSEDAAWQQSGTSIATMLLLGSNQTISVAAEPRGNTGCYQRRAQITTDYVEVRIAYRLPSFVVP